MLLDICFFSLHSTPNKYRPSVPGATTQQSRAQKSRHASRRAANNEYQHARPILYIA
jgi:hypothetical protein